MATRIALTEQERSDADLITLGCDHCRAATGLLPLHPERIADHTWYYCPTCDDQWIVDPSRDRMPLSDALFGALWLAITVAILLGIFYLITIDAVIRYGRDYFNNGHFIATLGVGALCWLVLVVIGARVYFLVLTGLTMSARLVWDAIRPVGSRPDAEEVSVDG